MAIEWTDTDPATGERRFVRAEKFARKWQFKVRFKRRTDWDRTATVTRDMWETLLDALERRYRRREGVSEEDIESVRQVLADIDEEDRRRNADSDETDEIGTRMTRDQTADDED